MMKQKANEADQESDLREAFKIFDREYEKIIINNIVEITYLQQGWIYRFEGAENGSHHVGLYAHQGGGGGVYERGRCGEFRVETSIKNKGYKVLQCSSQGIRLLYVLILVLERFSLNIDIFPGWKWKT